MTQTPRLFDITTTTISSSSRAAAALPLTPRVTRCHNMRPVASSNSSKGVAAIVGVGPKLGRSVARKFAQEGYTVAILSRDLGKPPPSSSLSINSSPPPLSTCFSERKKREEKTKRPEDRSRQSSLSVGIHQKLSAVAEEIAWEAKAQVFAIRIDCSESQSVREAFEGVLSLGFVEVLVYNAGLCTPPHPTPFMDTRVESFRESLTVSSVGSFHCAQQVIPGMVQRGKGTIIFTGSSTSVTGFAGYYELCCGKFALRGLSQCLAREFQQAGIHVAHIIIDGAIGAPGSSREESSGQHAVTSMDPDILAQTYWYIHTQDKGAWTQEIDLRSRR